MKADIKNFQLRITPSQYKALERIARARGIDQAYWVQPLGMKIIDLIVTRPELLDGSHDGGATPNELRVVMAELARVTGMMEEMLKDAAGKPKRGKR